MSYQLWSVVFGEQPSASKWNILGTNDASFNDGTGIADNVITGRQIQLNNNQNLEALNASSVAKNLMRLDNDNYLRLSQLPYQSNTTNSTKEDVLIQSGWGFIVAPGGTAVLNETVTFPAAFDTLLSVVVAVIGVKASDPSGITDFSGYAGDLAANVESPTATNFQVNLGTLASNNLIVNERWGYTWIAMGTKA